MKVVINSCFGGFGLSHLGIMKYAELSGLKLYPFVEKREKDGSYDFRNPIYIPYSGDGNEFAIHYSTKPLKNGQYEEDSYWSSRDIDRTDPFLIKTVEEFKEKANGMCASLSVVEIPNDIEYEIEEYDGNEHIAEKHRTWG